MSDQWQLQEAKNRFSEVVDNAIRKGPQMVTRRGVEAVVVISASDFKKIKRGGDDLVDFFRKSPLRGARLDLTRLKDYPRGVDL